MARRARRIGIDSARLRPRKIRSTRSVILGMARRYRGCVSQIEIGKPPPPALAEATVLDASGNETRLGEAWRKGPCLVLFLRHFGCIGCAEQVEEISPRLAEIETAGVRTIFVGNGAPSFIEGFVERFALGDKR